MPDIGQLLSDAFAWLSDLVIGTAQDVVQLALDGLTAILDNMAAGLVDQLQGVISGLPVGAPLGLASQSGIIVGYGWLNTFLPVAELLTALALIVTVATAIFAVRLAIKLWEWLPFKFS